MTVLWLNFALHQYNKSEPTRQALGSTEITHSSMQQRRTASLNKSVGLAGWTLLAAYVQGGTLTFKYQI